MNWISKVKSHYLNSSRRERRTSRLPAPFASSRRRCAAWRKNVLLGDSRRAMDELRLPTLDQEPRGVPLKVAARTASRQAERDLIAEALERTHWNRKRAARELQISYKSLLYKIKQAGLEGKQGVERSSTEKHHANGTRPVVSAAT